jgi:hypothetical protein
MMTTTLSTVRSITDMAERIAPQADIDEAEALALLAQNRPLTRAEGRRLNELTYQQNSQISKQGFQHPVDYVDSLESCMTLETRGLHWSLFPSDNVAILSKEKRRLDFHDPQPRMARLTYAMLRAWWLVQPERLPVEDRHYS